MIQIRDAHIDDLPRTLTIYNQSVVKSTATFDLEEKTLEERQEWFSHHGGAHPLIVAELDGEVVGYSCLSRFRDKPAYAKTVESSVYIDERHTGKGIGKLLMKEILKRAVELGHHVVTAGITAGNDASIQLHLNLGFELVGVFKEVGYKFGAWQDVHFYQLMLPASDKA